MSSPDSTLIGHIVQDTGLYLDCLQRQDLLWADLDNHIVASHLAEHLGDVDLVTLHLHAVTRLMLEIHLFTPKHLPARKQNAEFL